MAGKIIGLGSVGLTQYLIWSVMSLSILLYATSMTGMGQIPSINPVIFIYFVVFFILGYFLYATVSRFLSREHRKELSFQGQVSTLP